MSQVEISVAAADLRGLVERARAGEEVVLADGGPGLRSSCRSRSKPLFSPRRLGLARGLFRVPDDFDAPLPDDLLDLFYHGPIFPDRAPEKDDGG